MTLTQMTVTAQVMMMTQTQTEMNSCQEALNHNIESFSRINYSLNTNYINTWGFWVLLGFWAHSIDFGHVNLFCVVLSAF